MIVLRSWTHLQSNQKERMGSVRRDKANVVTLPKLNVGETWSARAELLQPKREHDRQGPVSRGLTHTSAKRLKMVSLGALQEVRQSALRIIIVALYRIDFVQSLRQVYTTLERFPRYKRNPKRFVIILSLLSPAFSLLTVLLDHVLHPSSASIAIRQALVGMTINRTPAISISRTRSRCSHGTAKA